MAYSDFKGGLATFNEYIAAENQSINLSGEDTDDTVIKVEIGGNMKTMICNLLAGNGLVPMPQIQICLDMNLNALMGLASANAALFAAMASCRTALQAFNEHTGISATLARLNAVIGEAAAIASMINFCDSPINPKPIPNLLESVMGSFLGAGEAILNRLGRVIPERAKLCFTLQGKCHVNGVEVPTLNNNKNECISPSNLGVYTIVPGMNSDAFIDGGLLDDIEKAFLAGTDISGLWEDWVAQLRAINDDFNKIIHFENEIAKRATETKGLGKSTKSHDPLIGYEGYVPVVTLLQPPNQGTVTPLITTRYNQYSNGGAGSEDIRTTVDVAIKFSERMNPDTVTARLANAAEPAAGSYGTIRISHAGTELTWSTPPQHLDDTYSRYGGTVQLPNDYTANDTNFSFAVGNNQGGYCSISGNATKALCEAANGIWTPATFPTSETGQQMMGTENINFQCNLALAAVAGTGSFVGMELPGQSAEDKKLGQANYPDIPTVMNNAQNIMSVWNQLAGYPVQRQDGTILTNIFDAFLDDETKALAAAGENYIAPVYTQVAEKDYCGNITGYKYEFTQGSLETPDLVAVDTLSTLLTERPIVLQVTPFSTATNILIDASITLRFSQDMDSSTFTIGDTRTTWNPNVTYVVNDIIEYVGKEYKSIYASNLNQIPSLTPSFWQAVTDAQTTAGTGTVRMIDTSDANKHVEGTISYTSTNRTMTYTPSSNLIASHVYEIKVVGSNTSTTDKVSPIENISGVTMTNTFSSSFTVSETGSSSSTGVVVTAVGSTLSLPKHTVSELGLFDVTTTDSGLMAWCTNETNGACTVVYNGNNWVRVDTGATISA